MYKPLISLFKYVILLTYFWCNWLLTKWTQTRFLLWFYIDRVQLKASKLTTILRSVAKSAPSNPRTISVLCRCCFWNLQYHICCNLIQYLEIHVYLTFWSRSLYPSYLQTFLSSSNLISGQPHTNTSTSIGLSVCSKIKSFARLHTLTTFYTVTFCANCVTSC